MGTNGGYKLPEIWPLFVWNVGVVRANHPAPMKRISYYFEVLVRNRGEKGRITVGFATSAFIVRRSSGMDKNSCGYSGISGLLYNGSPIGEVFGPTFTTNDIGCVGINYKTNRIFFTLNGVMVGLFNNKLEGPLFPVVSAHSPYEEVTVNFGQNNFMFDLEGYEVEARLMIHEKIDENIEIPQNDGHDMTRSYLQHCGYGYTLGQLDKTVKSTMSLLSEVPEDDVNEEDIMYALNHRTTLRRV